VASLAFASFAGVVSAATTLTTTMTGSEERPGPGDPNGKGWISLDVDANGTICYVAKIQAIGHTISDAHIHLAPAGSPGGFVVPLHPNDADRTGNMYSHCVTTSTTTAAAMIATPSAYYVNWHTPAFPAGAIRGQLGD
jgi:hypothetical protein